MSTAAKKRTRRSKAHVAKVKATALHSQIVRSRGHCQNCGESKDLQCAHIISRRYSNTRTDLNNAFALCAGCHMRFTEWPLEFADFVEAEIGIEAYNALVRKAGMRTKVDWELEVARLAPLAKVVA